MNGELTVGLLGAGVIAAVHACAYRESPGVRLLAVADPVPGKAKRLADQYGAKVVPDLDELLELGVDVEHVEHVELGAVSAGEGKTPAGTSLQEPQTTPLARRKQPYGRASAVATTR